MKIYQVNESQIWYKQNQLCFIIHTEEGIFQPLWRGNYEYDIVKRDDNIYLNESHSNLIYKEEE